MSALINETPIIDWKHSDNTFTQISAGLKYNNIGVIDYKDAYFRALPLKIYRKEIATISPGGNTRTSGRIFDFSRPGGTITTKSADCLGVSNTQVITNNSVDNGCNNNTEKCSVFLSPDDNARRRVRSSGMVRKKYTNNNSSTYFTNTKQYLESRNLSYKSNSNFHVTSGDVTSIPGTTDALQNIYAPNSGEKCLKEQLYIQGSFKYYWIDDTSNNVVVEPGFYDVGDLNQILHNTMSANYHYYTENPTGRKIFLASLKYNQQDGKIQVETFGVTTGNTFNYTPAKDPNNASYDWTTDGVTPVSDNPIHVQLQFDNTDGYNTELYTKMGYTDISGSIPVARNGAEGIVIEALQTTTKFNPRVKQIYYKPNNHSFATQGAVSSSDLINRRKYNTINTVAGTLRSAYGNHTANSVAYGVPSYGYTIKDKIGYPMKKTPTFTKESDIMKTCNVRKFANAI